MSSGLPVISSRRAVRTFERAGFRRLSSRGKGSHIVLSRDHPPAILTIPRHREIKRGTLRALVRAAGMTVEEFVALL